MSKHLFRDLDNLKKQVLAVGGVVENAVNKAVTALTERRIALAGEIMRGDDKIDGMEVELEENCLKVLALHQPVATDLRFLIVVMKVNNDLERMGDLAVNIAERASYLASHEPIGVALDFSQMGNKVYKMVHDSLDALVNFDARLARQVWCSDDEVDVMNRKMFIQLQNLMKDDPRTIKRAIHALSASRHLERIADLATNIAEDIIFMVEGEVIRHRMEKMKVPCTN